MADSHDDDQKAAIETLDSIGEEFMTPFKKEEEEMLSIKVEDRSEESMMLQEAFEVFSREGRTFQLYEKEKDQVVCYQWAEQVSMLNGVKSERRQEISLEDLKFKSHSQLSSWHEKSSSSLSFQRAVTQSLYLRLCIKGNQGLEQVKAISRFLQQRVRHYRQTASNQTSLGGEKEKFDGKIQVILESLDKIHQSHRDDVEQMVEYIQEDLLEDLLQVQEDKYRHFLQQRSEHFNQQKVQLDRLQTQMAQRWRKLVELQEDYSGQVRDINQQIERFKQKKKGKLKVPGVKAQDQVESQIKYLDRAYRLMEAERERTGQVLEWLGELREKEKERMEAILDSLQGYLYRHNRIFVEHEEVVDLVSNLINYSVETQLQESLNLESLLTEQELLSIRKHSPDPRVYLSSFSLPHPSPDCLIDRLLHLHLLSTPVEPGQDVVLLSTKENSLLLLPKPDGLATFTKPLHSLPISCLQVSVQHQTINLIAKKPGTSVPSISRPALPVHPALLARVPRRHLLVQRLPDQPRGRLNIYISTYQLSVLSCVPAIAQYSMAIASQSMQQSKLRGAMKKIDKRIRRLDISKVDLAIVEESTREMIEQLDNQVQILEMKDCNLSDLDSLPTLCHVEHLSLKGNLLKDCDYSLLLTLFPSLRSLDLSFNLVTHLDDLSSLFLSQKNTLRSLNLTGNPITRGRSVQKIRSSIFRMFSDLLYLDCVKKDATSQDIELNPPPLQNNENIPVEQCVPQPRKKKVR